MKRESFGRKAAFAALALLLIWGCRKITSSPAGDPALEGKVSISEEATVGAELSVDTTQLEGTGTLKLQWESGETADGDFAPIEGAADAAYTPLDADAGKYIRVTVTREGYSGSVSSNSTPVKAAPEPEPEPEPQPEPPLPPEPEPEPEPPLPVLTGSVSIPANAKVGEELSVDTTQLEGSGTITYQWQIRDGTYRDIQDATDAAYTPVDEDEGKYIRVIVKREGYSGSVESDPAGPVALPPLGGSVKTSGVRRVGDVQSVDTAQLEGTGTISYQWQSGETAGGDYADIEGAAGAAYTPVDEDEGKYIKVIVKRKGYSGGVESAAKGPLLARNITVTVGEITGPGEIYKGEEECKQYEAGVEDYAAQPGEIIWSIVESSVSEGTSITQEGWLTVAFGETRTSITVRAASVFDESASKDYPVQIKEVYWKTAKDPALISAIITIAFGNGVFVAADNGDRASLSTDGITWIPVTNAPLVNANIYAIAYGETAGNGRFVAVGAGGKAAYSDDGGETWEQSGDTPFDGANHIEGIAYGEVTGADGKAHGRFVAVGRSGKIAYSDDGVSWMAVSATTFTNHINDIAFGNSGFVAVGQSSQAAYSDDGVTWTAVNPGFGNSAIYAIAYGETAGNGKFVAVGAGGKMAYSDDGVSWTAVNDAPFGGSSSISDIAFGGGKFVAVGAGGKAAYSTDGVNWTAVSDTANTIEAIAFGNGRFVVVSYAGKIEYSNLQE